MTVEEIRSYNAAYYQKNRVKLLAASRANRPPAEQVHAYNVVYRRKNRVRLAVKSRAYHRTDAGRQSRKRDRLKRQRLSPEKIKARSDVSNAIRLGKLTRQPCEVCSVNEVEAHHDDYAKTLDVRWLCKSHHNQLHQSSKTNL